MKEFLYGINSAAIAGLLFVSMAVAIEAGYRIGRRKHRSIDDAFKSHINGISASLLGVLALVLGFTFSLSLQRFESRSEAVVSEANAISTTYLRAQLLTDVVRDDVRKLLHDYIDLRVQASSVTLADRTRHHELLTRAVRTQENLWTLARKAVEVDPNPVTTGLFIQSLNELIDNFDARIAALERHVPEIVLLLLYATFVMAGAIIGYSAGIAGHRASFVAYIMISLIVVLVFIILDLDRPRRGLIRVNQENLVEVQAMIDADITATTHAEFPEEIQ